MIESAIYASTLEKKLIIEFKNKFRLKMGYDPIVLTKITVDEYGIPLMSLETLESYFDSFLPVRFGKKVPLGSKSRKRDLVELRMMFVYIARTMKYTCERVGEFLGGRDHTTIVHNIHMFGILMETSDSFREKYYSILTYIKQNHESPALEVAYQVPDESQHALLS
jgi:hypothetical protein